MPLFSYIFWSFLRVFNTLIFFVILDSIVSISNGSAAAKTIASTSFSPSLKLAGKFNMLSFFNLFIYFPL